MAVPLLAVDVPGDVSLRLLESELGPHVTGLLSAISSDVPINSPKAAEALAAGSRARQA